MFGNAMALERNGVFGSRGEALAHVGEWVATVWAELEAVQQDGEADQHATANAVADALIGRLKR